MKYKLYFTEWHSDVKLWVEQGYLLTAIDDSDGWGEFEHIAVFEAKNDTEAKELVYKLPEMDYNSSGVFNVYKNGLLAFTEEGIR